VSSSAPGIVVVGVASNIAEALQLAQDLQPDVTLVDIDLGGESGFELAGRLREHGLPRSGIVLISTRSEEDYGGRIAGSEACVGHPLWMDDALDEAAEAALRIALEEILRQLGTPR
jgi:DNA-binding NarL/FixJ family response regulator